MISAKLKGGLGNQLFQIATVYALAMDNNDDCAFNFNMKPIMQGNGAWVYKTNIYSKLKELPENWKSSFIFLERELEHNYQYQTIPYHKNMIIDGYFNQQYFNHRKKEIVDLFKNQETISKIRGQFKNSVSIHVRRGDYLKLSMFYVQLGMDYYNKALSLLDKKTQIDRIYVMSDGINWCKQNFKDDRIEFIEGFPDFIDLYIMSQCTNNILANSSFSWWGTYLNENPDKIVYCPEKWFGLKGPKKYEYLFCDNFIRL